ncbi:uncharacterized protein K02A2.6-like [Planococcus citri]|uniref:uncharacterized protein K02A2.6-like n=1 Tax=Planococcus citri TaxID=170843 RepID=UPI0031F73093
MTTLDAAQITSLLQSIQDQSKNISALAKNLNMKSEREHPPSVQLAKFDESVETFSDYVERLEQYFIAQKIGDDDKVSVFISMLQPKLYRLLKHLCVPTPVEKKTFKQLTEILVTHLCPKQMEIPARHTFVNRKQAESEPINQYVAELCRLVLPCNYPDTMLSIMLRDMFVGGLRSKDMLNRLFTEKDLTFKRAVEIAVSMETSAINSAAITSSFNGTQSVSNHVPEPLKKLKKGKPPPKPKSTPEVKKSDQTPICFKCAKSGHRSPDCKEKNLKCNFCQSEQHVIEVCQKKKKFDKNKAKKMKSIREVSPERCIFPIDMVRASDNSSEPPIFVCVRVNDIDVKFEYDTGATKTVITESVTKQFNVKLKPTEIRFEDYSGKIINPLGTINVTAQYRDNCEQLDLFVVANSYSSVIGRDWIFPLKIGSLPVSCDANVLPIREIRELKVPELDTLVKKYSQVFEGKIGPVKKVVSLHLKEGAKPVFQRSRVVPLALQQAVLNEIDRLVEEGLWIKVNYSDWASPIVPVLKSNGDVRLCGDYSGTINDQIHITQHPFPGYEEIFSNVEGEEFTTLDIDSAFRHMLVDEASSWLMVLNTPKGLFRPTRLEFGAAPAPAEFQNFMDEVFAGLPIAKRADDIFVGGKD